MTISTIVILLLRLMGALWLAGGAIVINQMRLALFVDKALIELDNLAVQLGEQPDNEPVDVGRNWWMLSGGILTFICGAGLVAASPLVIWPLVVLVVHQALYAQRQSQMVKQAPNEQAALNAAMTPAARKGAITSAVVLIVAILVLK